MFFSQFPKGDRGGSGNVERINAMLHGDAHDVVGCGDDVVGKAVALGAHDEGQARYLFEDGIVERDGIVAQCHGGGLESQRVERWGHLALNPCPGYEEHRAHRDAHGTAVQRVTGRGCQQHGINAQGSCRAEDGADVGRVGHGIDDHDATGITANLFNIGRGGAAHGAKHTARERIARERGEQVAFAGIDGDVAAALDDASGITGDVSPLTQQRQRLVARVKGDVDDLGALGNEDALVRLQAVAQLRLGQGPVNLNPLLFQLCDLNNCHKNSIINSMGSLYALTGANRSLEVSSLCTIE